MAFERYSTINGASQPYIHYLKMKAGESCVKGQGLVVDTATGTLTKAGATVAPIFISGAAAGAGEKVPVYMVLPDIEFKVNATVAMPATLVGSKVTLHTDGASVTNTTTSGVFFVSFADGKNEARGYFR